MKRDWLWIGACFGLGEVLYHTIRPTGVLIILTIVLIIAGIWMCIKIKRFDVRRAVVICGIAFLFGIIRIAIADIKPDMPSMGTIIRVNNLEEKNGRLVITGDGIIAYYDEANADIRIGNRIALYGEFKETTPATNPGQFDFQLYYKSKDIYYTCFADRIRLIDRRCDYLKQFLYELRRTIGRRISELWDEDDAGFISAALTGNKSGLNDDLYDLYRRNGIAHLLAISGLHISIIGMGVYKLLRKKFSYKLSGIIGGAWIVLYTVFTGASVSTLRAAIVLLITFLAGIEGRQADLLNSVGFAGTVILLISPYELFNCGMLLSFGAVIGIAGIAKEIIKRLEIKKLFQKPEKDKPQLKPDRIKGTILKVAAELAESLIVSISVQLFTLPIMAYFFFEISTYGIFLNLIVIPLMTYVVWGGIISIIISLFSLNFAGITAAFPHYIISIYGWLCRICDELPCHKILIGRPKLWQIVLYYLFFFAVLYSSKFLHAVRKLLSLMWGRETESS